MSLINKLRLLQSELKIMPKNKHIEGSYGGLIVRTDLRAGGSRRKAAGGQSRRGSGTRP